jgi:hypothetical protein
LGGRAPRRQRYQLLALGLVQHPTRPALFGPSQPRRAHAWWRSTDRPASTAVPRGWSVSQPTQLYGRRLARVTSQQCVSTGKWRHEGSAVRWQGRCTQGPAG